jgi:hypothetical protein
MSDQAPLGWNLYTGHSEDTMTFAEFIPGPDLDARLEAMTGTLIAEIGAVIPEGPRRLRRLLAILRRH